MTLCRNPITLVHQSVRSTVRHNLPIDELPRSLQQLCIQYPKEFTLPHDNSSIVVRAVDYYDHGDSVFVSVKNGKYKVFYDCISTLFIVHSELFERCDLKDMSNFLSKENWTRKKFIFVDRGYIGVFVMDTLPKDKDSFADFYWNIDINGDDKIIDVSERGVVSDVQQGGHDVYILKNINDETIGIKIDLYDCGDSQSDED